MIYFGRASFDFQRLRRVLMVSSMCFGAHKTEYIGFAAIVFTYVNLQT